MSETTEIETGTTDVRGAKLHWSSVGDGDFTLFAHGVSSSSWGMENAKMFDLSPVSDSGRRLVRYDARGHGLSSGHPDSDEFTFEHLAEDLLALNDVLAPGQKISAIGCSLGTATLLHAVLAAPQKFSRLVLTAPPTAWETRAPQVAIYNAGADLIEKNGLAAFGDMVAQISAPEIFSALETYPPALEVSEALLPSVMRGVGASTLPSREEISTIDLPVLILAWAGDNGHPVSTATELHRLIPNSRLEIAETMADLGQWGDTIATFLAE